MSSVLTETLRLQSLRRMRWRAPLLPHDGCLVDWQRLLLQSIYLRMSASNVGHHSSQQAHWKSAKLVVLPPLTAQESRGSNMLEMSCFPSSQTSDSHFGRDLKCHKTFEAFDFASFATRGREGPRGMTSRTDSLRQLLTSLTPTF